MDPLAHAGSGELANSIEGKTVEVDSFGNLITSITREMLADVPTDLSVSIRCEGHETAGIYAAYAEQPALTLVAVIGSDGRLKLAIVDESAAMMLGIGVGAAVEVCW